MNRILHSCLALLLLCAVCVPVAQARSDDDSRADVQTFYDTLQTTLDSDAYAKNPAVALPFFDTTQVRLFDAMAPERIDTNDFVRHRTDVKMAFPGNVTFSDMQITAHDDVAFASYVQHLVGQRKDGTPFDVRMPTTDGLLKAHGKWKIVHQHVSMPMDDATLSTFLSKSATASPAP